MRAAAALALLLLGAAEARADLAAAVLPASRSVLVGGTATAFATIINTGPATAFGCDIAPLTSLQGLFGYQTTDPVTNEVTGTPNTPALIPPGGAQSYVFGFTTLAPAPSTDVAFSFSCVNASAAPIVPGLNTLLLSASIAPVADVVALAATPSADGIVSIPAPGATGVFAVATVNLGITDQITLTTDTGLPGLPVTVLLCETNPTTGQCASAPSVALIRTMPPQSTFTFAAFVTAESAIPFDPAHRRIFVTFRDRSGIVRGATSVAVRTVPPVAP